MEGYFYLSLGEFSYKKSPYGNEIKGLAFGKFQLFF